ncbi:uncharacterized protein Z518_06820 [Rhinocladiella mackenziei CBS 650.93]|uniref:Uncharacterized protein n=1 Tax=Rhinocladiella mackenziei CBS 650.93 TaxID=1442369 RepID=A0A0D2GYI4_9EURO|nr:uncharacterized protein Z518_06820 [Rhinocladiella mackenziei CBS 650.93]KIX03268.1 hypothetical protein Z518_06820 [Rhinocladiella mackenziei CBS 650.93]
MRLRDEVLRTQQAIEAQRVLGEDINDDRFRAEALRQTPEDIWKDDLDADRVGREDFEADAEGRRQKYKIRRLGRRWSMATAMNIKIGYWLLVTSRLSFVSARSKTWGFQNQSESALYPHTSINSFAVTTDLT